MSSWMQDVRDGEIVKRSTSRRRLKGLWQLGFAFAYWLTETGYFGWNFTAQSGAEMACDGIALLLLMFAWSRIADSTGESNAR